MGKINTAAWKIIFKDSSPLQVNTCGTYTQSIYTIE